MKINNEVNNEEREAMEVAKACEELNKELAMEATRQGWDMHKPCKWHIPDPDDDEE